MPAWKCPSCNWIVNTDRSEPSVCGECSDFPEVEDAKIVYFELLDTN